MTHMGEFEFANPVEKIMEATVNQHLAFDRSIMALKPEAFAAFNSIADQGMQMKVLMKRAFQFWSEEYERIKRTPFPEELITLLGTKKKKTQEKLLSKVSLTSASLIAFIFAAWEQHGYTYSVYESQHLPNGANQGDLPTFAYKDEIDGRLSVVGTTHLSEGQIKAVIEDRKVVVAKFLDKGVEWHCFFLTYDSITGKEAGETPHIHYISHAWGFTREQAVQELKSRRYGFPSTPHIPFTRGGSGD
jgi:hypothetical protein